ncbi:hypothetical protein QVD99_004913 [Batrachochytrium dendrobatidis]|nr:hypothetical protein QVD99_004913 [Batrachochytrium dendrobatidis]
MESRISQAVGSIELCNKLDVNTHEKSIWLMVESLHFREARSVASQALTASQQLLEHTNTSILSCKNQITNLHWILGCIDASFDQFDSAARHFKDAYVSSPHLTHLKSNHAIASLMHNADPKFILDLVQDMTKTGVDSTNISATHLMGVCLLFGSAPKLASFSNNICQKLLDTCLELVYLMRFSLHTSNTETPFRLDSNPTCTKDRTINVARQVMYLMRDQIPQKIDTFAVSYKTAIRVSLAVKCCWICSQILGRDDQELVISLFDRIYRMAQSIISSNSTDCNSAPFPHKILFAKLNKSRILSTTATFWTLYLNKIESTVDLGLTSSFTESETSMLIAGYNCYLGSKFNTAVDLFTRALKTTTRPGKTLQMIGCCLFKMGKFQTSLFAFRKSIILDQSDIDALINLAVVAQKLHNTQLEMHLLERILGMFELNDSIWLISATHLLSLLQAENQFERTIELYSLWKNQHRPISHRLQQDYAFALLRSGRFSETIQTCQEILLMHKADWQVCMYLGEAAIRAIGVEDRDCDALSRNLPEIAINAFRKSFKILSATKNIVQNKATATDDSTQQVHSRQNEDYKRAQLVFDSNSLETISIEKLQYSMARAKSNLGVAFSHAGCFLAAVGAFEDAIELDPDDIETRVNLALSFLRLGKRHMAIKGWQAYCKYHPWNGLSMVDTCSKHYGSDLSSCSLVEAVKLLDQLSNV